MNSFARTDKSLISRWWWTVDRWTLAAVLLLAGVGVVLTMAASPSVAERIGVDSFYFARRQFVYVPIAVAIMLVTSLLSPTGVRRICLSMFGLALLMTLATMFVGTEIKGAVRWLSVGGLSIQPSEFLKPAFAVASAWAIARSREKEGIVGYPLSIAIWPLAAGVLLVQPDVGTSVLLIAVWGMQIFLAGCPLALIALLALLGVGGAVGAYFTFSHVQLRVNQFLDPGSSEGYQVNRALEAFQSGGLFGRGPGEGRVKEVLPDAHADFIFAVAGEEFGLIVCILIVALFAFVVLRSLARTFKDEDLFVILAGSALVALFGMQALMNMASTMHLIPPKGITLPFISYGGSATLALAWAMGMMLAMTRERPKSGGVE
ncbi:FtsW/RodA/SpoVE family cell cycle protein [Defluviicoccus vanus]|uniref:Probable peptidoglycan glycosyltransferase FtsW n=1 Tax=Defluviicoccus vanus TaxID=111831 RepID=A0A7H1N229_9PROT|nr:putative peptidoglycan glycosyltransferase FtsW [Defluviicoccus vanus]QNT69765.1 cell division protein FtsW [Defluviicoccus vanus]